ncbi:hypothetical protein [Methylobacter sp.]|uniref:hypothetical protein n=1 Tax=Methylobacter sp. TaxID=2051955 RepID=UPI003DA60AC7
MSRSDQVRDNYFKPLETAESIKNKAYYLTVALSFYPSYSELIPESYRLYVSYLSIVMVVFYWAIGFISRIYLSPRANDARAKEFISTAFGVELIHHRTDGYYNNDEPEGYKKMALMILENSFFTKEILKKMAIPERIKFGVYFVLWLILFRISSFDILSTATTLFFSEEVVSNLFRIEWQRMKTEKIFDELINSVRLSDSQSITVPAIDSLVAYETSKSLSGILLSSKIFNENNARLSNEWDRIRESLS